MTNASSLQIIIQAQDQASKIFNNISKEVKGTEGALNSLKTAALAIGPALAGAAAGFISFRLLDGAVGSTQELGESVRNLSLQTGLSSEASSHMISAFKLAGVTAEEASRSLGIFAKGLKGIEDQESGDAAKAAVDAANAQQSYANATQDATEAMKKATEERDKTVGSLQTELRAAQETYQNVIDGAGKVAALNRLNADKAKISQQIAEANKSFADSQARVNETLARASQQHAKAASTLKPFDQAMKDLGLTIKEVTNESGQFTEEGIGKVADAFKALPDGVDKSADALALFGRNGTALLPFLDLGAKGFKAAAAESDKFGTTLSPQRVQDIHDYTEAHRKLSEALEGLKVTVGLHLMKPLTDLADWFSNNQPTIRKFADEALGYLGEKLTGIIKVFDDISHGKWQQAWEDFKTTTKPLIDDFAKFLNDTVIPALNQVGKDAADAFLAGLKAGLGAEGKSAAKWLSDLVGGVHITGPGLGGPIGARAEGGPVLAGAPYMVGENGPEWFVPGASGRIYNSSQVNNNNRRMTNFGPVTINIGGDSRSGHDALDYALAAL